MTAWSLNWDLLPKKVQLGWSPTSKAAHIYTLLEHLHASHITSTMKCLLNIKDNKANVLVQGLKSKIPKWFVDL